MTRAYVLLWAALVFEVLSFGVGASWDRQWHASHPFEDFFSPPHLFIYTMHLLATVALAAIVASPALRTQFGNSLLLAAGGFGVIALAGVLDGIWHTAFGLDETSWFTPHSMLGWGLFVAFVGLASCRLAFRARPIGYGSAIAFSLLLLATTAEHVAGPLARNLTPETVRFIARIPVLAAEPDFQHTTRITLAWNLTRVNPLFIPLAAFGTGLGLGLVRAFDRRWLPLLVVTAVLSRTSLLPLVIPGVAVALHGVRGVRWWAWLLTGLVYGVVTARIWEAPAASVILAAPLMLGGALIARPVAGVMTHPERRGVTILVGLFGIGVPLATGGLDLWLRMRTP